MIFDHEYMFAIFPHEKSLIVVSGGVGRLYQGLLPALIQAPLSRYLSGFFFKGNKCLFFRFGDTAGNVATLTLLANSGLPIALQTATASLVSAGWRMLIMPIDTVKTTLQVRRTWQGWHDGYLCRQKARPRCSCSGKKLLVMVALFCGTELGRRPLPRLLVISHGFSPSTFSSRFWDQGLGLGKMPL